MTLQPKEPAKPLGNQARQHYLVQAQQIIGEELNYSALYQRFAQNDWAAVKLDDAVAVSALKAGMAPKDAVNMLHQGPYVQYQVHVNQVPVLAMSQYARGTVIQALHHLQRIRCKLPGGDRQSGATS